MGQPDDQSKMPRTEINAKRLSRRRFLVWAGRLGVVVGLGALGVTTWRAVSQGVFAAGQGPAYDAWRNWNSQSQNNLDLIRAAIVAANAHDSQPWLFRLGSSSVDLYANTARNLGTIDPLLREMYISLGCALENLVLAAGAKGLAPTVTLMPDTTDTTHAAHVDLIETRPGNSTLFRAIPNRHTNRAPYDTSHPISSETLSTLEALIDVPDVNVKWLTSDADRASFANLTIRATEVFIGDRQQASDDLSWYRNDWSQLQAKKDGITIDASGLTPLTAALAKIVPVTQAQDDQGWLSNTQVQVQTAAVFGLLMIPNELDLAQRIRAGRIWQRMHLWATTQGLAMQPLNQTVERADREKTAGLTLDFSQALAMIQPAGWQIVFPFRLGYPTQQALDSPRLPAEQVVQA